ncbi:MAG: HAMP domain-containing histidine kinase [Bacteroidales bacterium]|nr:HAMP domain-containing histidine kinase [Bacteroidales bacterium]
MKRFILGLFVLIISTLAIEASNDRRAELIDSLEDCLQTAATPADSTKILFDIFDLSTGTEHRQEAAQRVYRAARAARDTTAQITAIMHRANLASGDAMSLNSLRDKMKDFDPSLRVDEVTLFIDLLRTETFLKENPKDSATSLQSLILRHTMDTPADYKEQIALLFSICNRIAETSKGDLLVLYEGQLEKLVEKSPLPVGAVRNLVYTRAASTYSRNDRAEDAVRIDKKTLNIIDSLSVAHAANGRKFRKLEIDKYNCYRRMLANYKVLAPLEVEQFHKAILDLVAHNSQIEADYQNNPRTIAYYLMAKERYEEAVPYLLDAIAVPANSKYHIQLYTALEDAAAKSGMESIRLHAADSLSDLYRDRQKQKNVERDKELKLLDFVTRMREGQSTNIDAEREEAAHKQMLMTASIILVFVLLVVTIVFLARQNRRNKALAAQLKHAVKNLREERNVLKKAQDALIEARDKAHSADRMKSDFINNMSHEVRTPLEAIVEYTHLIVDCIPDEKRNYLERFAHIIDLNSHLLLTLVNDVLDIASAENGNLSLQRKPTQASVMCEMAVDTVFENRRTSKPDVKLVFDPSGMPDVIIDTDPQRVVQILVNLLKNADKFTENGSIQLEYKLSKDRKELMFIVSDTGIGIPAGQEEEIFTRFKQLDTSFKGCGLGLYISRLIARLLGGTVEVDTDYHKGARFILTLPL